MCTCITESLCCGPRTLEINYMCAQLCLTLCDLMNYSLPGHFPGKNIGLGCHFLLQGIFMTQGSNLHLLHWQGNSSLLSHLGSPYFN